MAETKTPLEANGDTIAEIQALVENLPEAGGAVDDNLKVIARLTTTEEATQVTLDKDLEGNDFALKEAIISITPVGGTANTERANMLLWCNGQNTAVQRKAVLGAVPKSSETTALETSVHVTNADYGYWCECHTSYATQVTDIDTLIFLTGGEKAQFKEGTPNTVKTNGITSFTISFPSDKEGYTFGVGTQIIIQGVRM